MIVHLLGPSCPTRVCAPPAPAMLVVPRCRHPSQILGPAPDAAAPCAPRLQAVRAAPCAPRSQAVSAAPRSQAVRAAPCAPRSQAVNAAPCAPRSQAVSAARRHPMLRAAAQRHSRDSRVLLGSRLPGPGLRRRPPHSPSSRASRFTIKPRRWRVHGLPLVGLPCLLPTRVSVAATTTVLYRLPNVPHVTPKWATVASK